MFNFRRFFNPMYAAASGITIGSLLLFISVDANAVIFNKCTPDSFQWEFISDPEIIKREQQNEALRCEAENKILDEWKAKLDALELLNESIQQANEDELKAVLANIKKSAEGILKSANENPHTQGASSLRSLFSESLNYYFQNVGLSAPSSLNDAFAKIEKTALSGKRDEAITLLHSITSQLINSSIEFAKGLSTAAGAQVRSEVNDQKRQVSELKKDKLQGRTVDGYFSGFSERLSTVWKPWLMMFMVVTFLASWIAIKKKVNPVMAAIAAGGSYLLPGTIMAGALIFFPFLPSWFLLPFTLAGTGAVFLYAGKVFNWLANHVGNQSGTARRLRTIGGTIDNIRAGLSGSTGSPSHNDTVTEMTAKKATHGSARWGTTQELTEKQHLNNLASPPPQAGLALARVKEAPKQFDQRFRFVGHVVTVAPNGSGKGIGAVIPNLLEYPGSCLVLDVKGENAAVTKRARRELGHKVYQIDPFEVNKDETASFNVLDRIDLNSADCVSESAMLSDSLVISDGKDKSDHFDESAKTLLQGLMLYVVSLEDPEKQNLGELRRLLTADEETLLVTLADMATEEHIAFGVPARAANTIMGMADRERGSVLSTARRNTAFLDDPRIAKALSYSDFDLTAIKSDLMSIYLVIPANKIATNARFVRLFVGSVIAAITASSEQPPHRVAFFLDEFAQLGYMKQIEDAVSLMRGYGLAFWVFLQDLSQLKAVYPRWQTFLANSAKTFFGTDDYDTAKYVSDSLGQATIEYETQNEGSNSGSGLSTGGSSVNRGKSTGSSQQYTGRALLTPDEVMRLGPERPIVLVKGEYPYQLDRLNYLSDLEYSGKADPNPYHS